MNEDKLWRLAIAVAVLIVLVVLLAWCQPGLIGVEFK